jgi:hypothetical protein
MQLNMPVPLVPKFDVVIHNYLVDIGTRATSMRCLTLEKSIDRLIVNYDAKTCCTRSILDSRIHQPRVTFRNNL